MQQSGDIVLFGASVSGSEALHRLRLTLGIDVTVVVDNDSRKHGQPFHGFEVKSPEIIATLNLDKVIIGSMYGQQIRRQLIEQFGVPADRICMLPGATDFSESWYVRALVSRSKNSGLMLRLLDADLSTYPQDLMATHVAELARGHVPYEYWLHLYFKLCMAGNLTFAHTVKKLSMKAELATMSTVHPADVTALYCLLVEQERYAEAMNVVESSPLFYTDKQFDYELFGNTMYLEQDQDAANRYWSKHRTQIAENNVDCGCHREDQHRHEQAFGNLIYGKTVAIVGAADTDIPYGKEIDAFDAVIRPNYTHFQKDHAHTTIYGCKTSISYINNLFFQNGTQETFNQLLRSCRANHVALCGPVAVIADARKLLPEVITRGYTRYPGIYRGHLFATQSILIDIAKYAPRRVKIFCTDLFSGPKKHHANYPIYREYSKLIIQDDPVLNFLFARKYLPHLSEYDVGLERVLNYSLEEYVERFTGDYYRMTKRGVGE